MSMKFAIKTSIGLVCLLVFVVRGSDTEKSNISFNDQCQALKCNPTNEICRLNPECDQQKSKCVYCASKEDLNSRPVSKTLLASSLSQRQAPLAPRLLAKSNGDHLLATNHDPSEEIKLNNETSYDDYYEYDEDETSDKDDFGEEDDYLDDYAEPIDSFIKETNTIRKFGICPKVLATNEKCDPSKEIQSECRFDTDCSGEQKCCESTCGKRVCNLPIKTSVSVCPSSFTCTLNCRLGYQTDANGCLLCSCQSCPSMDHCQKNCPSGYLKDLFGCDICECSDQCPPFSCSVICPPDVGFAKSSDGCPLCQCETTKTKPVEYTSSCQDDVHCPPGFRCLNDARNVPMCQAVPETIQPSTSVDKCSQDFAATCSLQCVNNKYAIDEDGCPICACASQPSRKTCPLMKCRDNCGELGYKTDSKGCRTCECASKSSKVECSRVMCRMFCAHGFRRDENGCEICSCNSSPQPCPSLTCDNICLNGYRKDYSGCQTCSCNTEISADICPPMKCDLECKHGFERDPSGCSLCSCNQCPMQNCRRFCMYGFKKNSDGCESCECDWTPIAEKISCSERIGCEGNRVCNLNLKYCELVNPEKINWFFYDFAVKSNLFQDAQFVKTFKKDLINNIAEKYDLERTQIAVSSVEDNGMTSFQVMPFFIESVDDFQKKMDQIDIDFNTHEFRSVLPSVARNLDKDGSKPASSFWSRYIQRHSSLAVYIVAVCVGIVALLFAVIFLFMVRYRLKHPGRSESKSPIYDTSYHRAPTEDDHFHAVHAPDGTAYVVVESEEAHSSNDRRALV